LEAIRKYDELDCGVLRHDLDEENDKI
jgi:hypothetical protein